MFYGSFVLVTTLLVATAVALPQSRGRVRYNPDSDWTQYEARNIRYEHFEPDQLSEVQRNIGFAGAGANYDLNNVQSRVVESEPTNDDEAKPKPAVVRKAFETTKKPYETAKSKNKILTLTAAIGTADLKDSTTPVSIEEPLKPLVNINARTKGFSRPIPLRNVARNEEVTTTTTTQKTTTEGAKKANGPFRTRVNKLEPVKKVEASTTTTTAATTTTTTKATSENVEEVAVTAVPEEIVATTLPAVE